MTKKEFCEIMAAGHSQAGENLRNMAHSVRLNREHNRAENLDASADREFALERAFRSLSEELGQ